MNDIKTKIIFYSKSADAYPGKGTKETLVNKRKFKELSKYRNFRKQLSNFWTQDGSFEPGEYLFELDSKKWASLEHFFHYVKFRNDYPRFANTFEFNSGSKWSRSPLGSKQAGKAGKRNKAGKFYDPFSKKYKDIVAKYKVRGDFYKDDKLRRNLQILAAWSKFSQNEYLKNMLLATKDAELYHYMKIRGQSAIYERWDWLEKVRECLKIYENYSVIFEKKYVDEILK